MSNENQMAAKLRSELSAMKPATVSDIEARSVLVRLTPPELASLYAAASATGTAHTPQYQANDLFYTLELCDKGTYTQVYSGDATEITLKDLRPASQYTLRVHASLSSQLHGDSHCVQFQTRACEPDQPHAPKEAGSARKKNEINLRWNSVVDNGSKVLNYILECDEVSHKN